MAEDTSQPSSGPKKRKSENGDKLQVSRKAHLTSGSAMEGLEKYFFFIKEEVSSDWRNLAFLLGFGRSERENINERNRDDKSRCMDLLEEWHNRKGREATIEVLMEALSEANLQRIVDGLKNKYPELQRSTQVLPVRAELSLMPHKSDQASTELTNEIMNRLWEMHRDLFTAEVLMDDERRRQAEKVFLEQKAFLIEHMRGSVIFLLTFLRQTDVDRFYHNHYRVGEGTLSQQLSHILISDELQRKVKGAQLIVRLQVKHEDYVRVRNRLGRGLDRTTSLDNILALSPRSRRVDHFCVRGLDLAMVRGGNQSCTESTHDATALNFTVRQAGREKSQQQMEGRLQVTQGELETERQESKTLKKAVTTLTQEKEKAQKIVLEQKIEIQQLQETHTANEERIKTVRTEIQNAKEQTEAMVQSLRKEVTRLTEEKEEAQKTLQKQNLEIQQILDANKRSESKIDELTAKNTKLTNKLTDIPKLREKVQGLSEKLQETKTAGEQIIETMREDIQNAKEQTEAMVNCLMKEVTRLTEEKEEDKRTLQKQNLEIQQILETNKSSKIKIDELTAKNTKLTNQLTDITKLREEVQGLRQKDETSQKVLSEQKREIHQLQMTIKNKEERSEMIQEQINTARQQTEAIVHRLSKEVSRVTKEKEETQKILQEQKLEIQQLQEVNKSMAGRIEELLSAKKKVEDKGQGEGREKEEDPEKEETKTGLEDQAIGNVNQTDSEVIAVDRFYRAVKEGDVQTVRRGLEAGVEVSVKQDLKEKDLSKQAKQEKTYHELMQQPGGVKFNRFKVFLGGKETTGKTTLKTSLTKGLLPALIQRVSRRSAEVPYDPTPGVDIGTFHVPGVGEVSLWDFAGQTEYAVTHSMFMDAENTVFIVLYNIMYDRKTQQRQVHWWLCFIKACNPNRQSDVILVASHADKVTLTRGQRQAAHVLQVMQSEFGDHLRIADEVILMDCRKPRTPEMERLKALLVRIKDVLLQHQRDMPRLCAEIMKRLPEWHKKISPTFPVMTWHQYVEEVRKLDRLVTEDFLLTSTRFLHHSGEVLFITPATSYPILVLKPNWLGTDVFGRIMAPDNFPIPHPEITSEDYVTRAEIQRVFQDVADVDLLITLLQEFQLCHSYNGREFIFPGLLTKPMPDEVWQLTQEPKVVYFGKQVQCAESTDMFSSGFFPRVQTRLMRDLENHPLLWRDGAKCVDRNVEGLIKLSPDGRAVNICVRSAQGDKVQCGKMLQQLENIIADVLDECSPGTGTVENVLSARALKEHGEEFYSYGKEDITKATAESGTIHHPTLGFTEQVSDLLCREEEYPLTKNRPELVQTGTLEDTEEAKVFRPVRNEDGREDTLMPSRHPDELHSMEFTKCQELVQARTVQDTVRTKGFQTVESEVDFWEDHPLARNRPELVQSLRHVEPILDHLLARDILTIEECEVIRANNTPQDRARALLDTVGTKGEDTLEVFRSVLREVEPRAADLLMSTQRSDKLKDREDQLTRHRPELVRALSHVEPLLDHLQARDVISTEECDIIRTKSTSQERARALLDTVGTKGGDAREQFKAVLGQVNPEAAELMLST
ncbi:uncharacterized protein LOC144872292 [Branchiostoma floridae x Branchiostoma japonicum]